MLPILALLVLLLPAATAAAETTFLPGARLGLELPPGFRPAAGFPGFENLETGATFFLTERPREAWSRLRGSFTDTTLKGQGIEVATRETLKVGDADAVLLTGIQTVGSQKIGKWILVVGDMTLTPIVTFQVPPQGASQYTPEAIRQAMLSLKVRAPVTMSEQVAGLPFTIGDISGFHVERTIESKAAILSADPADPADEPKTPPPMFVAFAMPDRIPGGEAGDAFARAGLMTLSSAEGIEIETSREMDFAGSPGHEIVARAVDKQTGNKVVIVQWLRPLPSGLLRYVGIGPDEQRDALLAAFSRLRDAIEPKS